MWVEVANAFKRFIPDPFAVIPDVFCETFRVAIVDALTCARVDRLAVPKPRRELHHCLADHDGDRVQIRPVSRQPKALRF